MKKIIFKKLHFHKMEYKQFKIVLIEIFPVNNQAIEWVQVS